MTDDAVYATRPLLSGLLEFARDRDPDSVSVVLRTRSAGELAADSGSRTPLGSLGEETPVFAEFSFPDAGSAVNRVFGMDLGRPARTGRGRFVSHPDADPALDTTDDLAPRVLVAIPAWTLDDVNAYDRNGVRHPLRIVDASAPPETLDDGRPEGP